MSAKRKRKPRDLAILQGPTEDGKGARVLRLKDGALSAGEIRPAREGEPIAGRELVRLKPLSEDAAVCEVEVLHAPAGDAPAPSLPGDGAKAGPGPAQVATDTYRKNWSAVFGGKRKRDYSLN
jgi:hypothetical protein